MNRSLCILGLLVLGSACGGHALMRGTVVTASSTSEAQIQRGAVSVARVLRDGEERQISAEELVPGDMTLLGAGDRVPADGRVIEQARLQVDEAALTGESVSVEKSTDPVGDPTAPLGDRVGMVHMGTAVTDGRGGFIVTATGARTEMGKIGTLIEGAGARGTPLEAKLAQLSRALLVIVLVLCVLIIVIGLLRGVPTLFMVEIGISLAIAAVPEGLLAVTTMTLAVGMQRMACMNALVRRLPAVEALGATTVICTDKTGTLTRNEMTVREFELAGGRTEITGTGYAVEGDVLADGAKLASGQMNEPLTVALRICALCNDAKLDRTGEDVAVLGDPTEAALIVVAEKAGMDLRALERDYPRTAEVPFDSVSKRMATVHTTKEGKTFAYVKGAPGAVLDACVSVLGADGVTPMSKDASATWRQRNDALAARALRVLGLAYRELPAEHGGHRHRDGDPRHRGREGVRGHGHHR